MNVFDTAQSPRYTYRRLGREGTHVSYACRCSRGRRSVTRKCTHLDNAIKTNIVVVVGADEGDTIRRWRWRRRRGPSRWWWCVNDALQTYYLQHSYVANELFACNLRRRSHTHTHTCTREALKIFLFDAPCVPSRSACFSCSKRAQLHIQQWILFPLTQPIMQYLWHILPNAPANKIWIYDTL